MTAAPNAAGLSAIIQWGAAGRAISGEAVSGDSYTVTPFPLGALVAVVDGLGHGAEAASAAKAAIATLSRFADAEVLDLMQRCHAELRATRGVAMSIASLRADRGTMTWLGVGNVEGAVFHMSAGAGEARQSLLLRGGVVGYQLPPLRAVTVPFGAGDTLILATDGIRGSFYDRSPLYRDPQIVADDILARHGKDTDDALVVVVRCLGGPP
jgi:hypothetical protein